MLNFKSTFNFQFSFEPPTFRLSTKAQLDVHKGKEEECTRVTLVYKNPILWSGKTEELRNKGNGLMLGLDSGAKSTNCEDGSLVLPDANRSPLFPRY